MTDNRINVFISFDSALFERQKCYNADYANKVNKVLAELADTLPDLTNEDAVTFLADPQGLADKIENADREEYDSYAATLPKSVASSMTFKFDKGDIIAKLHKKLPQPQSYFFTINTCKIEDGVCVFDEDALKERCTVYGPPNLLTLWNKAQEVAKSLNDMQKRIKAFHKDMHIIEDSRSLNMGIICNDGKGYAADIDRLKQLT